MEQIIKITTKKLTQLLLQRHTHAGQPVFANIEYEVDARLKKTGNPFPGVTKKTKMTVMLNSEYETGVVNQLKREGKDESEYRRGENSMPLEFGRNNTIVGFFNGDAALQYRPFDKSNPTTEYFTQEGIPVRYEDIKDFLPSRGKADNQGTEKQILWNKLYMKNLRSMKIDGVRYEIENENA